MNGSNTVLMEKKAKKRRVQRHYDRTAKDLATLKEGTPVLLRDYTSHKTKWQEGSVVRQLSGRSYMVTNAEGNVLRRNRVDIRTRQGPTTQEVLNNKELANLHAQENIDNRIRDASSAPRNHSTTKMESNRPDESITKLISGSTVSVKGSSLNRPSGSTSSSNSRTPRELVKTCRTKTPLSHSVTKDSAQIQGDTGRANNQSHRNTRDSTLTQGDTRGMSSPNHRVTKDLIRIQGDVCDLNTSGGSAHQEGLNNPGSTVTRSSESSTTQYTTRTGRITRVPLRYREDV
jgi:hypothetical protein